MKKLKILITPLAEQDFIDIWGYIFLENEIVANKIVEELHKKISYLSEFPFFGVEKPEVYENLRLITYKRFNIYYLVKKNQVEIIRILHGSREIKELF